MKVNASGSPLELGTADSLVSIAARVLTGDPLTHFGRHRSHVHISLVTVTTDVPQKQLRKY
jgi:hypothetical protein